MNQNRIQMRKLGDLLERVRRPVDLEEGRSYREIGIRSHGKGVFHKEETNADLIGKKRVFWVESDCVVFNIVFAWEGAIAVTQESDVGFIASHRFPMYRANSKDLLVRYVSLCLLSGRGNHLLRLASPGGAGRNRTLNQAELLRFRIPLPSLEGQRKVVAVSDAADIAISQAVALIAARREFKRGLANALLTESPKTGGSKGRISQRRFGDLVRTVSYRGHQIAKSEYEDDGPYQVVDQGKKATAAYCSHPNPIVAPLPVVVFGDHTREVKFVVKPFVVGADGVKILTCATDEVEIECLYRITEWASMRIQNLGYSRHFKGLAEMTVPVPPPELQGRIATVLRVVDAEIEILETLTGQFREQKRGLVQRLFSGDFDPSNITIDPASSTEMPA